MQGRQVKRARRRVTAELRDFLSFPMEAPPDERPAEPFRSGVRAFLSRHARPQAATRAAYLQIWRVELRIGDHELSVGDDLVDEEPGKLAVELDVVEEDVWRARSVYCDQCRVVGWSSHPVCAKRYHFIIRSDNRSAVGNRYTCGLCQSPISSSDLRCSSCNYELTSDDLEDQAYFQLDDPSHLLHGMVHANGYGHLLRVNGREGGSKFLSGSEIMAFWDRLCCMLCVRKVTVMDIAKKYGMEYRLLHAVTSGSSWYGTWGYQFAAGSYALNVDAYEDAVKMIAGQRLALFFSQQSRLPRTRLQDTITLYQSLSDCPLSTVQDLFRYITDQLYELQWEVSGCLATGKKTAVADFPVEESKSPSWSSNEVERVEKAMINVLSTVDGDGWVSYRVLKGATCLLSPFPRLLDCCLKDLMGKQIATGKIVMARRNTQRTDLELRLSDATLQPDVPSWKPSADQLLADLKFLYGALLDPVDLSGYKSGPVRELTCSSLAKILDCKQFIKHYDEEASLDMVASPLNPFSIRVWCNVELLDQPRDYAPPPPELLVLPLMATVAELKHHATAAFQETYLMFQRFQVEQLLGYGDVKESTQVKLLVGTIGAVRVRGCCFGDEQRLRQFRMERGLESWTVNCPCGAKDDDGERMLACDSCGVWQHTRCAGIKDNDRVPVKFVCSECMGHKNLVGGAGGSRIGDKPSRKCNDELLPFTGGTNACSQLTVG